MVAAAIAVAGTIATGVGIWQQNEANEKAESEANALSNQSAALTQENIALENQRNELSLAASQEQANITRQQEQLRLEEATREFVRAQREIIRQTQVARGQATNSAANSGALQSSGFQGGVGQILQGAGANLIANKEAFAAGLENFELNEQLVQSQENFNIQSTNIATQQAAIGTEAANINAALQQVSPSQTGSLISSLGTSVTNNAESIAKVGTTLFSAGSGGGSS